MILGSGISSAYAYEPIPITYSGTKDHVQFDGKWTFQYEWKESSLNTYSYEDGNKQVILRSAHQGNFVYILLDAVTDESINDGLDKAVVCFDTKNNKSIATDSDDFCFLSVLGNKTGIVYQGDANSGTKNSFKEIPNPNGFIGVGGTSDNNDRYSGVPHTSYELKIPTDVIGRNNIYGFYFAVYDDNAKKYYTYPTEITTNEMISSPSTWGEIYSPDKSLPEFYLPFLVTIPAFAFIIILSKTRRFLQ